MTSDVVLPRPQDYVVVVVVVVVVDCDCIHGVLLLQQQQGETEPGLHPDVQGRHPAGEPGTSVFL